jgi:nucleotide-binding universal stress UspA family protein
MDYRTILALVSGQAHDQQTLAVSCDLARRFEAEVRVAPCSPDPADILVSYDLLGMGFLTPELGAELQRARAKILEDIGQSARKAAADAEIMFGEPRVLQSSAHLVAAAVTPGLTLLKEGPFADLAVIAREAADDGAVLSAVFAEAWNGSMEAGRAVRAALPLLLQADQVVVVQRERDIEWGQRDAASLERCLRYLGLHGVPKLETRLIKGKAEGDPLMEAVNKASARLLVAGAYGHPLWQEFLFGGVTRAFLRDKNAPHLLISH